MAKLKIGEAVSEVKDIKIDDVEAQGVSGVIDNSRNWTSITIGDTTGTIPAGSSGLEDRVTALEEKLDGVTRTEEGLEVADLVSFDALTSFDGTINAYDIINIDDEASLFQEEGRVGQYVGEEFKKFGYVEEVEFQGKGIGPGQAGVTVDTVVEDKLYVITINIAAIPEEYHFPTNIEGTILEIYSESQSNWLKPMWTYYNNETGYLKQFAFFFHCDPDGEDICKFKILR